MEVEILDLQNNISFWAQLQVFKKEIRSVLLYCNVEIH